MRQLFPRKVKKGDAIKADDWNYLVDFLCRNAIEVDASTGLEIQQGPGGTFLWANKPDGGNAVWTGIVQSGGITARVSTTAGSGNVELQLLNNSGVYVDAGQQVVVYSISSTTGGVPSGTYINCAQDINGNWVLISNDCGN